MTNYNEIASQNLNEIMVELAPIYPNGRGDRRHGGQLAGHSEKAHGGERAGSSQRERTQSYLQDNDKLPN